MHALHEKDEKIEFTGIGGSQMLALGLDAVADIDRLSVNGLIDPLRRLPDLWQLLHELDSAFGSADLVVGVDFNVFNLIMEGRMKRRGIPTAHYVSPSVYAWRRGRVNRIGRSTDLVMTLFPFEPAFYTAAGVRAEFVGHPMADEIDQSADREKRRNAAREQLGLESEDTVVAVLPGSRRAEILNHTETFFNAAVRMESLRRDARMVFVVPCVNARMKNTLEPYVERFSYLDIRVVDDVAREVFAAANGALVKSGTGTLEAMLMRVPMVVAYIAGTLTYSFIRAAMHTEFIALPNILTSSRFVPELIQSEVTSENLARELLAAMTAAEVNSDFAEQCERTHDELSQDASARAADAVLSLLQDEV